MAKAMKRIALSSVLLTAIFAAFYMKAQGDLLYSLAITFATISYHFLMRLLVGFVVNLLLHNHVDYGRKWFHVSAAEQKLYRILKVKKWKGKMATYDPSCFDRTVHSWDEIAQATCQAELVHDINMLLSLVPILAAIPFGAWETFVITSVLSACFDGIFVIIQRYNRPRILKLIGSSDKMRT